jgi:hypothetical protein
MGLFLWFMALSVCVHVHVCRGVGSTLTVERADPCSQSWNRDEGGGDYSSWRRTLSLSMYHLYIISLF